MCRKAVRQWCGCRRVQFDNYRQGALFRTAAVSSLWFFVQPTHRPDLCITWPRCILVNGSNSSTCCMSRHLYRWWPRCAKDTKKTSGIAVPSWSYTPRYRYKHVLANVYITATVKLCGAVTLFLCMCLCVFVCICMRVRVYASQIHTLPYNAAVTWILCVCVCVCVCVRAHASSTAK